MTGGYERKNRVVNPKVLKCVFIHNPFYVTPYKWHSAVTTAEESEGLLENATQWMKLLATKARRAPVVTSNGKREQNFSHCQQALSRFYSSPSRQTAGPAMGIRGTAAGWTQEWAVAALYNHSNGDTE